MVSPRHFLIDSNGLLVVISGHSAAVPLGGITTPDSYHLSVVLIPSSPGDFAGESGWQGWDQGSWGGAGSQHSIYQTIGGQPQGENLSRPPLGNLTTSFNYNGDGPASSTFLQVVSPPNGMSDTKFIRALRQAAQNYSNDQRYCVPDIFFGGYMAPDRYDSNSFAAGLFVQAIGLVPTLNIPGRWTTTLGVRTWVYDFQVPGYGNPVPMK